MTSHYIGCSKGILIVLHYDRYNPCVTGWYGPVGAAAIQGLGHCSIANLKNARVHYSSVFFWLSNKHENLKGKTYVLNFESRTFLHVFPFVLNCIWYVCCCIQEIRTEHGRIIGVDISIAHHIRKTQ